MTVTIAAGHIPTGDELTAGFAAVDRVTYARRTADSTPINNSTTMVADSQLTLAVAASGTYHLRGRLIYTSSATPDFRFGWTYPTGLTMSYSVFGIATGTAAPLSYLNVETDLPALEGAGVGVSRDVWLEGLVFNSTTAGNLVIKWAQATANATDTVMKANSYFILTKLG